MRKTPIRPSLKPIKRSPLKSSRTPIKTRRTSKRFQARRDPKYCAWIRTLPCVVPDCPYFGPIECTHVVSRGAGGSDRGNCVPLCHRHHRDQHIGGIETFQVVRRLDLAEIALGLLELYGVEWPQQDGQRSRR